MGGRITTSPLVKKATTPFHVSARHRARSTVQWLPIKPLTSLVGPVEDQKVLHSMVRHESAILRWLEMESEGNTDGSLDAMIAELQYPLPAPEGP